MSNYFNTNTNTTPPMMPPTANAAPLGAGFDPHAVSLTGEALLFYCQTQLNGIDNEITAFMERQKLSVDKKKILNELVDVMGQNAPPKTKEAFKAIGEALDAALEQLKALKLPPNDPSVAGLTSLGVSLCKHYADGDYAGTSGAAAFTKWEQAGPGSANPKNKFADMTGLFEGNADPEPYQGFLGEAKNLVADISANAELNMIEIQSAVSKRQTVVQLTTNMMAKIDGSLAGIVANFK